MEMKAQGDGLPAEKRAWEHLRLWYGSTWPNGPSVVRWPLDGAALARSPSPSPSPSKHRSLARWLRERAIVRLRIGWKRCALRSAPKALSFHFRISESSGMHHMT